MDLTRRDQEDLAALLHNPGYLRLLDLLAVSEKNTLAEAEGEADPAKLLRTVRFWQFLHKVNAWLRTTPGAIQDELARLRESGLLEQDETPLSRQHAWNMRFRDMRAAEEQDLSDDPANI